MFNVILAKKSNTWKISHIFTFADWNISRTLYLTLTAANALASLLANVIEIMGRLNYRRLTQLILTGTILCTQGTHYNNNLRVPFAGWRNLLWIRCAVSLLRQKFGARNLPKYSQRTLDKLKILSMGPSQGKRGCIRGSECISFESLD